jgi:hypothetical protein
MNDDAPLQDWLSSHRAAIRGSDPEAHVDVDTLARHATGQLSPAKARLVTEHLLACFDGRCHAFVREQIEGAEAAAQLLYSAHGEDPTHERTFQCREVLWQTRGHLDSPTGRRPAMELDETRTRAPELDALRAPAPVADERLDDSEVSRDDRRRYGAISGPRPAAGVPQRPPMATPEPQQSMPTRSAPPGVRPAPAAPAPARAAPPPAPPMVARAPSFGAPPMARGAPPPVPAGAPQVPPAPPSMRTGGSGRPTPPPLPRPATTDAPPPATRRMGAALGARLTLTYRGQAHEVDADRYLIGRSKTQADLRVDDPNISRQHAAIERVNGVWYVVDLGSTNGVYVGGQRVTRRPLVDGDVIEITTHQIHVTLR